MRKIDLVRRLEVLPGNKLIPPGCEPLSAVSAGQILRANLCRGLVGLGEALAAIPGSTVEYGADFGVGQRLRWFVLPPTPVGCSCTEEDWYAVLRRLARVEEPVAVPDPCGVLDMGFCPSPDFQTIPPPPKTTYIPEGTELQPLYSP